MSHVQASTLSVESSLGPPARKHLPAPGSYGLDSHTEITHS